MSPQQDQSPGLRLPQPSFDVGQAPTGMPQPYPAPMPGIEPAASPVVMPPAQSYTPQQAPAMPAPSQPQAQPAGAISVPPAEIPQQPFAGGTPTPAQDIAAVQADDDSAVDQEWITKARDIVNKTHADPYLQSKEISKIKAQYIKVRYNKDIKTVEE